MRLSDLCDFVAVHVDPAGRGGDMYVGLEHVASRRFLKIGHGTASDVQSSKYAFRPGDILYGKLRPYLEKAVLATDVGICTTELLVLRPKEGVDPRFLICVVHAPGFVQHAVAGTTGAQHPRTSWNHIGHFELPSFELDEQTKIATLLWGVHDAIIANETSVETGTDLMRAAMQTLFTRGLRGEAQKETAIGSMPESWLPRPLRELSEIRSGGTPRKSSPEYWSGGIPWVSGKDLKVPALDDAIDHITKDGLDAGSRLAPTGAVLVLVRGMGLAKDLPIAVINRPMAFNQDVKALVSRGEFSGQFLRSAIYAGKERLLAKIVPSAHGTMTLNLDDIETFMVPCPAESAEAEEIVGILDGIQCKIDLHLRKRAVLDDLFKALLHKLITGEIRVADLDLSPLTETPEVAA